MIMKILSGNENCVEREDLLWGRKDLVWGWTLVKEGNWR